MLQDVAYSLQGDGSQKIREERAERVEQAQQDMQEEAHGACVIYIRALMRGLDAAYVPFVPFALLKHDPFAAVRAYIAAHEQHEQREYVESLTEQERIIVELVQMRNAWNSLFRELRSDQLFFLCAWSSVPQVSLNVVRASGLSFVIATPGMRRWLVTRPLWRRNELVAWCEAIDTSAIPTGKLTEVVLSEHNMLRLKPSLFCSTVQEERERLP